MARYNKDPRVVVVEDATNIIKISLSNILTALGMLQSVGCGSIDERNWGEEVNILFQDLSLHAEKLRYCQQGGLSLLPRFAAHSQSECKNIYCKQNQKEWNIQIDNIREGKTYQFYISHGVYEVREPDDYPEQNT